MKTNDIQDAASRALARLGDSLAAGGDSDLGDRVIETAFTLAAILASAASSFGFFATYAPALFAWVSVQWSPYLSGAVGALFLEGGSIVWRRLQLRRARTRDQQSVAKAMFVFDLVLAAATTALFLLLKTTLAAGVYDAAGRLTDFGQFVTGAGIVVMTLALVVNFTAAAVFGYFSEPAADARQSARLAAIERATEFGAREAANLSIAQRTVEQLRQLLPQTTKDAGQASAADFINTLRRMMRLAELPTGGGGSGNDDGDDAGRFPDNQNS